MEPPRTVPETRGYGSSREMLEQVGVFCDEHNKELFCRPPSLQEIGAKKKCSGRKLGGPT